ncbi:ATP-dependent nuclease subunit B-like protein [Dethiosulfovibrio peptidovorans DSM 11002]|uniref:ATP-dependent nuclease subunit B-like protein n=1 Tax=Dethiosulfovibrio peptidovorans DSM 11002 TaxID=469381 RepID=D2Z731_9BACT|nr:PD-(D/E)XK nuclease family protein [Dethiosulfovibrio peptidovorans]EFC91278.1 ATP-dependent nuclease subunit B-like protein [Dethiosulfovibrio peptidovorans DSM 11002]
MALRIYEYRKVGSMKPILSRISIEQGNPVVYLVPGSSDREWLKDILLEEGTFGREAFRIWRWDDLYREACSATGSVPMVQIDPPDHWLALHHLVRESLTRWSDLMPPGTGQSSFVQTLGETVRELIREEVPPEALSEALYPDGEDHPEEPSWLLANLYRRYLELLRSRGLMDSAAVSTEIASLIEENPEAAKWLRRWRIVLVGFYSFTHSQLGMVRAMVRNGADVTLLSPEAGLEGEYGAPSQLEGADVLRSKPSQSGCFVISGGAARGEMETVVRDLALWSSGEGPLADKGNFPGWGEVGMTVDFRSTSLASEVLRRYAVPFRRSEGRTVAETILWDTVRRAWDCYRDGWQPEPTAELLCLPWFFHGLSERWLVMASPRGLKGWRDLASSEESLAEPLERVVAFAEAIGKGGTAEELLTAMKRLVTSSPDWREVLSSRLEDRPELDEVVLELGSAVQELDRKLDRIAELQADLGDPGKAVLKGGDAMAFLSVWAESAVVWPGASRSGTMTLYGGTPPVLAHHRIWAFCGVTAKNWPGPMAESPLLGDCHKELLHDMDLRGSRLDRTHLPLMSEKRAQREVLFRRILACGDDLVILSYPSLDGAGRPLPESPFIGGALRDRWIDELGKEVRSVGNVLPRWEEPALLPSEVQEPPKGIVTARPDRRLPSDPIMAEIRSIRLSSIDSFAACPFMFRCSQIVGLEPPERPGYDGRLAGTAAHRLWRDVWKAYEVDRDADLASLACDIWPSVLEEVYRGLLYSPDLKRRGDALLKDILKTADYLSELEDIGLKNMRVASFLEWELPVLELDGVPFTGIADRIDLLDDGTVLIWDYKSGGSSKYDRSLQLACYARSLELSDSLPFEMSRVGGYGFICQRDQKVVGAADEDLREFMGLSPRSRVALDTRLKDASDVIEAAAFAANSGLFPPNYDNDQACRNCPYSGLCRRGELHGREDDEDDDR